MYLKGELSAVTPRCAGADEHGDCDDYSHAHYIYDSTESKRTDLPVAFLPHSCDSWVIGGKKEIQDLIDDLLKILGEM